jgi:predicted nucleotidyltransferase
MKDLNEIKYIIKQHRNIIADKYGIAIVGIFGSYVRGEQEQMSDIDLLADILRPISLFRVKPLFREKFDFYVYHGVHRTERTTPCLKLM